MCVFLSVFSPGFLYHFFHRIHPDTARKNETKLTLCILAHHLSYAPSLFYSRGHHRRPWASTNLDPFSNHPFLFKEWAKPCWNRSEYPAANPHLKNGTTLSLWKKSFKFYSLLVNTVRTICIPMYYGYNRNFSIYTPMRFPPKRALMRCTVGFYTVFWDRNSIP